MQQIYLWLLQSSCNPVAWLPNHQQYRHWMLRIIKNLDDLIKLLFCWISKKNFFSEDLRILTYFWFQSIEIKKTVTVHLIKKNWSWNLLEISLRQHSVQTLYRWIFNLQFIGFVLRVLQWACDFVVWLRLYWPSRNIIWYPAPDIINFERKKTNTVKSFAQ